MRAGPGRSPGSGWALDPVQTATSWRRVLECHGLGPFQGGTGSSPFRTPILFNGAVAAVQHFGLVSDTLSTARDVSVFEPGYDRQDNGRRRLPSAPGSFNTQGLSTATRMRPGQQGSLMSD